MIVIYNLHSETKFRAGYPTGCAGYPPKDGTIEIILLL